MESYFSFQLDVIFFLIFVIFCGLYIAYNEVFYNLSYIVSCTHTHTHIHTHTIMIIYYYEPYG